VTKKPSTAAANTNACATKPSCCAWKFAAALLLLRLCIGCHFFSEGTKKLSYDEGQQKWSLDFSAEGFFRGATGPLAGLYKSQLPGFYDWENLLAVPKQSGPLSAEEISKRQDWMSDYNRRRKIAVKEAVAVKEKAVVPIKFPEFAPYKTWGDKIVDGLRAKLKTFNDLSGVSDEQDAQAAELFVARHQQLADFLAEQAQEIEDYQHELWRQQQMEAVAGADEVPFLKDRLAAKRSETAGLGNRLVSEVRSIERGFNNDLRSLLTAEQRDDSSLSSKVESSLSNSKERRLHWMNLAVTCLVIGVGVCMLLGVFTRLAAVGGILFLLSVMVTQLPWVPGARADFFYYQLVECAALLALLVSSPWRLPGLDYLFRSLWSKCCGTKG